MLTKVRNIVFVSETIVGLIFSTPANSQSYEYVNALDYRHTISIQINPPHFAGGDRAVDAQFCHNDERYVCVSSADFNFAVPNKRVLDVQRWEHKGIKYELIGREKTKLLGQTFDAWIIDSIQNDRKMRFSYSRVRGLMAFSVEMDGKHYLFLSQREFGFGGHGTLSKERE